jgi:hypothetical protein
VESVHDSDSDSCEYSIERCIFCCVLCPYFSQKTRLRISPKLRCGRWDPHPTLPVKICLGYARRQFESLRDRSREELQLVFNLARASALQLESFFHRSCRAQFQDARARSKKFSRTVRIRISHSETGPVAQCNLLCRQFAKSIGLVPTCF